MPLWPSHCKTFPLPQFPHPMPYRRPAPFPLLSCAGIAGLHPPPRSFSRTHCRPCAPARQSGRRSRGRGVSHRHQGRRPSPHTWPGCGALGRPAASCSPDCAQLSLGGAEEGRRRQGRGGGAPRCLRTACISRSICGCAWECVFSIKVIGTLMSQDELLLSSNTTLQHLCVTTLQP